MAKCKCDTRFDCGSESVWRAGWEARDAGQPERAHELFLQSLDLAERARDRRAIAWAKLDLADNVLHYCPDDELDRFECRELLCDEALHTFRLIGDEQGVADALVLRASIAFDDGGLAMLNESLATSRRVGYTQGMIAALSSLGRRAMLLGDSAQSEAYVREAVQLARGLGDKRVLARALVTFTICTEADRGERRARFEEILDLERQLGRTKSLVRNLIMCAHLACEDDDYDLKLRYLNEALAVARKANNQSLEFNCLDELASVARARGDLSGATSLKRQRQRRSRFEAIEPASGLEVALAQRDVNSAMSILRKWFTRD